MKLHLHDGKIMEVPAYGNYGGIRIKSVELSFKDFEHFDKLVEVLQESIYTRMVMEDKS